MELIFSAEPSMLNLAGGVLILVGLLAYVYFFAPNIFNFMQVKPLGEYIPEEDLEEETLVREKTQSHEVFLHYDHSDVNSWATWMRNQDQNSQEQSFNRLAEYLQKPIKDLGVITTEVIKGLELLKHPFAYSLLVDFVHLVRSTWGTNNSAELFYDAALRSLVNLNPSQAQTIIIRELQEVSLLEGTEQLKEIIIRAATALPMNDDLAEVFGTFLLEAEHKLETRKVIVAQLDTRNSQDKKFFLVKTLERYVSEFGIKQISFDNSQILRSLFERSRKYIAAGDKEIWSAILQALRIRHLQMDMVELVCTLISDPEIQLKPWQIFGLIRLPGELRKRFGEAICRRFYMTELEKSVIMEPVLSDEYPFEPNIVVVEKMKREMFVPDFMEIAAAAFSTILIRKRNPRSPGGNPVTGMALIAGNGESEKLYLARTIAANTNRSFVYVDAAKIIDYPEKISELQKIILNARPCIVYIDKAEEILALVASGKENQKHKDFIYGLKKLSTNPNISVIASVTQGEHEAKRKYGSSFCLAYELHDANNQLREDMFRSYQLKLLERRANKVINPQDLITSFSKQNTVQFASGLHRYIRTSLMCFGQIVPFPDYEKLMQELPVDEPDSINWMEDEEARVAVNLSQETAPEAIPSHEAVSD